MPFSLPDSHIEFFTKHQILELEELLSPEDSLTLCQILEELLKKRLGQRTLENTSNALLWKAGRNLDKEEPRILKILFQLQQENLSSAPFKKDLFALPIHKLFGPKMLRIRFSPLPIPYNPLAA